MTIKILHKNIQTIVVIRNHSRPDSLYFSAETEASRQASHGKLS